MRFQSTDLTLRALRVCGHLSSVMQLFSPYFLRNTFFIFLFLSSIPLQAQVIDFDNKVLQNAGIQSGTALEFGPDGKLYVAQRNGIIKVLTINKQSNGQFTVTNNQSLNFVKNIPNHNDDGTLNPSVTSRQVTGITVGGTAQNPEVYVSSSDFQVGAGGDGGDINLDTNSGVITRLKWTGSSWEVIDLVRGLPRSEENHATNGMELVFTQGKKYLIVCSGGFTNAGSPSANFAFITEYALSGAILAIDLTSVEGMSTKTDGSSGRKYKYDLPTLDDPTRPNTSPGVDVNDPWGGNDGLNQSKLVAGGPVKMFSPGYRNAYDLVVTQKGAVYVTDNGANGGWGGYPKFEAQSNVNNSYRPGEPGSKFTGDPENGEVQVNNQDHLNLVTTNIGSYNFGSVYGGHPCPTRANPNAGLYTRGTQTSDPGDTDNDGATDGYFRTVKYNPGAPGDAGNPKRALPADWPPVSAGLFNVANADYRQPDLDNPNANPDGAEDIIVLEWGTNTNGIDEYTASNFGGAMKGNLIAGKNNGKLHRVVLNNNGTVNQGATELDKFTVGGNPLGITCQGDNDIFPGTIWVANFNQNQIVILDPKSGGGIACNNPGGSPNADFDGDGFTNQDEISNNTDPCVSASQPDDYDGDKISDLNDPNDDNDNLNDTNDPLQIGQPYNLPVFNEFRSDDAPFDGYQQLGITGLMNNGSTPWYQSIGSKDVLGGTSGILSLSISSATGNAKSNNQKQAYQYGVNVNSNSGNIVVQGQVEFNSSTPNQNDEGHGFFIGDGFQNNYIKAFITNNQTLKVEGELNGVNISNLPSATLPTLSQDVNIFFKINTSNAQVQVQYAIGNNNPVNVGSPFAVNGSLKTAIQSNTNPLIVGVIAHSNDTEYLAIFDFLNVYQEGQTDLGVLYRVNAGGSQLSGNGGKNWEADNKQYITAGGNFTAANGSNIANVPAGVPMALFQTERWDQGGSSDSQEMKWSFPVAPGAVQIKLYLAESYLQISGPGQRVFDVAVEGNVPPAFNDIDPYALGGGLLSASVVSYTTTVNDGSLDLEFLRVKQNPAIKGIEISGASGGGGGNQPPVLSMNTSTKSVSEGNVLTVPYSVSDDQTPNPNVSANVSPNQNVDVTVSQGEIEFVAHNGSGGNSYTVNVTATDQQNASTTQTFTVNVSATQNVGSAAAKFEVTPNDGIEATTFGGSKIILTNQSGNGIKINQIKVDINSSILPDVVWDPLGNGGDELGQCVLVAGFSSASAVGLTIPGNGPNTNQNPSPSDPDCSTPFSGSRNGGFDVMTLNFTDFDPNESLFFGVDIDPNSIKDVSGSGGAGSVAGLELSGATVTITFSNGATITRTIFENGGQGGGEVILNNTTVPAKPNISVQGLSGKNVEVGSTNQTITITGTPNANFALLQLGTTLTPSNLSPPSGSSFNNPPYYANSADSKTLYKGKLNGNGVANVNVNLKGPGSTAVGAFKLNYLMAVLTPSNNPYDPGEPTSLSSDPLRIRVENQGANTFSVSTTVNGNGSINLNPPGGTYNSGTQITVNATPNSGNQLTSLLVNGNSVNNPFTFNINQNTSVVANFQSTSGGGGQQTLNVIDDAFIQGSFSDNGQIVRVEPNNRVAYLKFNLSNVSGSVTQAQLKFLVTGDAGNGQIQVAKGSSNNWTETNLSNANKPNPVANLGGLNATYNINQTYTVNLNPAEITTGGFLSLIITQTSGNDFAFASDESNLQAAQLVLQTTGSGGPSNQAPSVNAGNNTSITLPNNTVNLNGTVSDDGLPNGNLSTQWSVISGSAGNVNFANANNVDTQVGFSAAGTYTLRLTANDGQLNNFDDVVITVNASSGGGGSQLSLGVIDDAFLQGSFSDNGNIVRVETNNRVAYLKFNLAGVSGNVTQAELQFTVSGDTGFGQIQVAKGSSNNWIETNLSNANKPNPVANLGGLNATYNNNQTYTVNLNPAEISTGGSLSLIITQTSGNDFAFASDESGLQAAKLILQTEGSSAPPPPPPSTGLAIDQLILVNASTNQDIKNIVNGDQFNASTVGSSLSVKAIPSEAPGSVIFNLNGQNVQTENISPYALNGDVNGNFIAANLPVGSYTLTATPFSGSNGSGQVGTAKTVTFSIVSGARAFGEQAAETGVETELISSELVITKVYPNPMTDEARIFVEFSRGMQGEFTYDVLDGSGRVITRGSGNTHGESILRIDLKGKVMSRGTLFIRIEGERVPRTIKRIQRN